jgi:hypothetical protein
MTDNVEEVIKSVSINQILIAILSEHGKITVPTLKFLDAANIDKELIIDYDEEVPSFIFSLRDRNE